MADLRKIFHYIPEVRKPDEKKLSFNEKAKWTLILLISFFVLANIPLYGLSANALAQFEFLAVILATEFGSLISLGIGPIVMASIILQLLTGSQILNIDTTTEEGKRFFQGLQKLGVLFFIVFEAIVFVMLQGLQPMPGFAGILIFQLILGGLAIYYMTEISDKWGFGSGVSLFIAAGVSWSIMTSAFQFMDAQGRNCLVNFGTVACPGRVFALIQAIMDQMPIELLSAAAAIIATLIIFMAIVWAQSLKVEIPLSYGRIRGYGIKWPLSFFYTSVIPIILAAALMVNIQLFGGLAYNAAEPCIMGIEDQCEGIAKFASYFTFLGEYRDGQAISGLGFWVGSTNIVELLIRGGFMPHYLLQGFIHMIFFMFFATLFSVFWVKTAGMDSKSQAKKIMASGLQVSGFRQDQRILESILDRYIMPLAVMGGLAIGFFASIANLMGALIEGTAILLVVMIMFQFYQNIAQQHQMDMHPMMKKFVKE